MAAFLLCMATRLAFIFLCLEPAGAERSFSLHSVLSDTKPDTSVVNEILNFLTSNYQNTGAWASAFAYIRKQNQEHQEWDQGALIEALERAEGRYWGILRLAAKSNTLQPVETLLTEFKCSPLVKDTQGYPSAPRGSDQRINIKLMIAALNAADENAKRAWMNDLKKLGWQNVHDVLNYAFSKYGGKEEAWSDIFGILTKAQQYKWTALLDKLFYFPADGNQPGRNFGLLHQAVYHGMLSAVKTLMDDYGASPYQITRDGTYPESQEWWIGDTRQSQQTQAEAHRKILALIKDYQSKNTHLPGYAVWKAHHDQMELQAEQHERKKASYQKPKSHFDVQKESRSREEEREYQRKLLNGEISLDEPREESKLDWLMNLAKLYPDEERTWKYIYAALKIRPDLAITVPGKRKFGFIHHAAYWGLTDVIEKLVNEYGASPFTWTNEIDETYDSEEHNYPDEVAARMEREEAKKLLVSMAEARKKDPGYAMWKESHEDLDDGVGPQSFEHRGDTQADDKERSERLRIKGEILSDIDLDSEQIAEMETLALKLWQGASPGGNSMRCNLRKDNLGTFKKMVLLNAKQVVADEIAADKILREQSRGWEYSRVLQNPQRLAAQVEWSLLFDPDMYVCAKDESGFDW